MMASSEIKNIRKINEIERKVAEFAFECVRKVVEIADVAKKGNKSSDLYQLIEPYLTREVPEVRKEDFDRIVSVSKSDERACEKTAKKENIPKPKFLCEFYKNISSDSFLSNYRSYAKKLPQMVLSHGLGQTLAFVYSKKKPGNAYYFLYYQLSEYFERKSITVLKEGDEDSLVEWVITNLSSDRYHRATEEAINFLNWLRRFAEGMIEDEQEQS